MTAPLDLRKVAQAIDRIATGQKRSQEDVACVLGIARETWNRMLNGRSTLGYITFGRIIDLADYLGVPAKVFFE